MTRDFRGHDDLPELTNLLQQIVASPEFCFSEGDFWQRLEHVCYYQIGNFQYPARTLLDDFFRSFSQKYQITVSIQDIHLKIVTAPVYKIPVDGAIMAQDTNHVIGPVEELMEETAQMNEQELQQELEKTLAMLPKFTPHRLGEILVSSPKWCKSPYLMEAVVYQFDNDTITDETTVYTTLRACLQKCEKLGINKVAVEALGTEYQILSDSNFVKILHKVMLELAGQLTQLKELIIAARDQEHANTLKKAFAEVLHIKIL